MKSSNDVLATLLTFCLVGGCTAAAGDEASSTSESSTSTGDTSTQTGASPELPIPDTSPCDVGEEGVLFGAPTANTGLGSDMCQPTCACSEGAWTPPSYAEDFLVQLDALALLTVPPLLVDDPYMTTPELMPDASSVCAAIIEGDSYSLETFDDEVTAAAAGGWVTHQGACGQCSSLANLAVYMRMPDLTDPVRQCGLDGIIDGEAANIECLMALGFDEPCAQIWYYNTLNTRTVCLDVCLAELENPNHLEDGSLNPCIQCDEDESGAVFKAVSGRTRRNSGLPSALCRPCDSVYRVIHDYGLAP